MKTNLRKTKLDHCLTWTDGLSYSQAFVLMSESMINLLHKLDSFWSNPIPYILILETLEISFHREIIIVIFVICYAINNNK